MKHSLPPSSPSSFPSFSFSSSPVPPDPLILPVFPSLSPSSLSAFLPTTFSLSPILCASCPVSLSLSLSLSFSSVYFWLSISLGGSSSSLGISVYLSLSAPLFHWLSLSPTFPFIPPSLSLQFTSSLSLSLPLSLFSMSPGWNQTLYLILSSKRGFPDVNGIYNI